MTAGLPPFFRKMTMIALCATAGLCLLAPRAYAVCNNPSGDEGKIIYNQDYNILQYCNDTVWVGAGNAPETGPALEWSGDFENAEEDFLYWQPSNPPSSGLKQTISLWFKRESAINDGDDRDLYGVKTLDGIYETYIAFDYDSTLIMGVGTEEETDSEDVIRSTATYTDTTSWHHLLVQIDLTQIGASNRIKAWVDGTAMANTALYESNNLFLASLNPNADHAVGIFPDYEESGFDGQIAEFYAIDGLIVPYTEFYDSGMARKYTGSFGNNGFYLNFSDPANLGADSSGNGHDFSNDGVELSYDIPPSVGGKSVSGLIARWTLDEDTGSTVTSTNGLFTGTIQNSASLNPVTGAQGGALHFSSADSEYIEIPHDSDLNMTGSYTLSVWAKAEAAPTAYPEKIIDKYRSYTMNWGHFGVPVSCEHYNSGVDDFVNTGTGPILEGGKWYHLACTYDGGNYIMYVNGEEVSRNTSVPAPSPSTTPLRIGAFADSNSYYFNGDIDDVRIYTRALTPAEVKAVSHACFDPFAAPGAIRYNAAAATMQYCNGDQWVSMARPEMSSEGIAHMWTFDEADGATVYDAAGDSDGTMTNMDPPTHRIAGQLGGALTFNGFDEYIDLPNPADFSFDASGKHTWMAWINPAGFEEWSPLFGITDTYSDHPTFVIYAHDYPYSGAWKVTHGIAVGAISGLDANSDHINAVSNNNVLVQDVWAHVAVTYDGSLAPAQRFKIYVNGLNVKDDSKNAMNGTLGNITANYARIGNSGWDGEFFEGDIDDFRIYDRALTQAEIQQVYDFGAADGCDNPPAAAGKMIYNAQSHLLQFCDGKNWRAAGR